MRQKIQQKEHFVPIIVKIPKNILFYILQIIQDVSEKKSSEINIFYKNNPTLDYAKVTINSIFPDARNAIISILKNFQIEDEFTIYLGNTKNTKKHTTH